MSFMSQYPNEDEILIPPLSYLVAHLLRSSVRVSSVTERLLGQRGAGVCRRVRGQMPIHEAGQRLDHELLKARLCHKEPDGAADVDKVPHRHVPALIKIHLIKQRLGEVGRSVAEHRLAGLRPLIPIEAAVLVCVGLRKKGLRICRDPRAPLSIVVPQTAAAARRRVRGRRRLTVVLLVRPCFAAGLASLAVLVAAAAKRALSIAFLRGKCGIFFGQRRRCSRFESRPSP